MKVYVCTSGDQELTQVCKVILGDEDEAKKWREDVQKVLEVSKLGHDLFRKMRKDGRDASADEWHHSFQNKIREMLKPYDVDMYANNWADYEEFDA